MTMGKLYGNDFSQTTISRFEALNLSFKNMCKLKPLLQKWLDDVTIASLSSNSLEQQTSAGGVANGGGGCSASSIMTFTDGVNRGGGQANHPIRVLAESLARRRKKRTNIDHTVRLALEQYFLQNSKPTPEEVNRVAEGLQMDKEVIQVWFCNRRQKEKRVHPAGTFE